MTIPIRTMLVAAVAALAATIVVVAGAAGKAGPGTHAKRAHAADEVNIALTPSSPQLERCMAGAELNVRVKLTTEKRGADALEISGSDLPPSRDYTLFLLEQAGSPFGAADYIGDFSTDPAGNTHNKLKLIVQEAFSSTLVNGTRVRVDLNRLGVWFADPSEDDFCFGPGGGNVTPFDGDGEAGVQAFNSAKADPLPAP